MDVQKEREAFEANFKTTEIYSRECAIRKKDILEFSRTMGGYFNIIANNAWELWQAAKAQAVPDGFVLINKESLAFHARSIRMFNSGEHYKEEVEEHVCSIEAMIEAQEQAG